MKLNHLSDDLQFHVISILGLCFLAIFILCVYLITVLVGSSASPAQSTAITIMLDAEGYPHALLHDIYEKINATDYYGEYIGTVIRLCLWSFLVVVAILFAVFARYTYLLGRRSLFK